MKRLSVIFVLSLFLSIKSFAAIYSSPGTGVNWTLADLVTNAGGNVSFAANEYLFIDGVFISTNDTLRITTDEIVKFAAIASLQINGVLIINPPTGVLFTAVDQVAGFLGMRFDFSNGSVINKLTLEYGSSCRVSDCSPAFTDCIFRYNNAVTTTGNGTISLFRASPVLNNCTFFQNRRAAIQGGANISNAPKVFNCSFLQNNTMNLNVPQINMGSTGSDTMKIIGCQIMGGNNNSGGIGFLPTGTVNTLIKQNLIKGNRYGITLNGGSNINAMISYNRIDDNNIQNDPNIGGSGIAFSGGTSTSHQNTIVTGNVFTNNLWGITILRLDGGGNPISGAMPNLGNLANADTSDDGKNHFINNTNLTTPGIDLYNNSSDQIFAMGNNWNTTIASEIEAKIFHKIDNPALGLVILTVEALPIKLSSFTAKAQDANTILQWQTAQENNSAFFVVEKSFDGTNFNPLKEIPAAGFSNSPLSYGYKDLNANPVGGPVYYRLKMTDKDGSFSLSSVVVVHFEKKASIVLQKFYPSIISTNNPVTIELLSDRKQKIEVRIVDMIGRLFAVSSQSLTTGLNKFNITLPANLPGGWMTLQLSGQGFSETLRVLKN